MSNREIVASKLFFVLLNCSNNDNKIILLIFHFKYPSPDGGIIFRKYDTPWRESRRFTLQALRDFGVGKSSLEDKITGEINAVGSKFDSLKGEPTSVNDLMQKVVANVMFNIVFGKRYVPFI